MSLSQTLQAFEALDSAHASGQTVVKLLESYPDVSVAVTKITGANGSTDFVRIVIPGAQGKRAGGSAPTLGIVGRLGGIGARPGRIGLVSDGDGAVAAVAAALADLEVGGGPDDPAIDHDWGEPGLSPSEQVFGWNSLDMLTFGAGDPAKPVNAIPPVATAWCQLRFVVGTDWRALERHLRAHLDAAGFTDVQVRVGMQAGATRLSPDNPWVRWAAASIERSTGLRPALLPNLGGSLPNDIFADLLGLPTLWVPHSYPACAQHAPNEHLLGSVAREGLAIMAGLFWDLGDQGLALRQAAAETASPTL